MIIHTVPTSGHTNAAIVSSCLYVYSNLYAILAAKDAARFDAFKFHPIPLPISAADLVITLRVACSGFSAMYSLGETVCLSV